MIIGIVCEGSSDFPVLEAVVEAALGDGHEVRYLRPETDALFRPGGWTAVKAWCEEHASWLSDFMTVGNIDLLIIHVDADVRRHVPELKKKKGEPTTQDLCDTIKGWLKLRQSAKGRRVLIVIPAQATEAWLVAAQGGATPDLEKEAKPVTRLVQRKLVSTIGGKPDKSPAVYRDLATPLRSHAAELRGVLRELDHFMGKLEAGRERTGARRSTPSRRAPPPALPRGSADVL
ncbi:uncharacterized protein SOCE26_019690 [Sorangium cellulosum]|uniref:Uncharacterized protein n=1 Tax=Sorangium cellulosum TaxID=56 RepID=A0A2L0EMP5_SORCE|nr:hypothetical protein [Sorangium cellulosum]AUX40568.1 uncharacterized protein SOCE26_019690 [Sorangium cellulosum]